MHPCVEEEEEEEVEEKEVEEEVVGERGWGEEEGEVGDLKLLAK